MWLPRKKYAFHIKILQSTHNNNFQVMLKIVGSAASNKINENVKSNFVKCYTMKPAETDS